MIRKDEGDDQPDGFDAFAQGMRQFGGHSPELDRLAEVARRFERLEWALVRRHPKLGPNEKSGG